MKALIVILLGYLIGSLNPSYFVSRIKGFDIRKRGTGNAGATNVMFVLGFKTGLCVMTFDILKAFFSAWIPVYCLGLPLKYGIASGISCTVGHIFPLFLGFKGGKGTACFIGVMLGLTPVLVLPIAIAVFAVGAIVNRASILPIIGACVYPVVLLLRGYDISDSLLLFFYVPLLCFSHRKNFVRFRNGEESTFRSVVFKHNLDECIERKADRVGEDKPD